MTSCFSLIQCHNLANTYGVEIINLLKNVAESDYICYQLKLCSDGKEQAAAASGTIKLL